MKWQRFAVATQMGLGKHGARPAAHVHAQQRQIDIGARGHADQLAAQTRSLDNRRNGFGLCRSRRGRRCGSRGFIGAGG
jgi:hypothetical protein